MRLIRELYRPDLAILPIGGHFTMGPAEAALAVEFLGRQGRRADPLRHVPGPRRAPRTSCRAALAARGLGDVTVHAPAPGGTIG